LPSAVACAGLQPAGDCRALTTGAAARATFQPLGGFFLPVIMASEDTDEKEATFFDHLEELRARLGRSILYIVGGMAAAWVFRSGLLMFLEYPARVAAQRVGIDLPFRIFEPAGGFVLMMVIALVAGVVISSPLWFMELWLFIEPALKPHEKRYVIFMLPLAVGLFVGGVAFCYFISPRAFEFFFRINQSMGVDVELTLKPYLYFLLRLLLAFGAAFELPLILMFLGYVGIVNSRSLARWWRHAVVGIFIFAAIVTPTTDPFTMTFMAVPLIALYGLSILLVKIVEKRQSIQTTQQAVTSKAATADEEWDWEAFYGPQPPGGAGETQE